MKIFNGLGHKLELAGNYVLHLDIHEGERIVPTDMRIVITGKELKRIEELINMFNKLQDNPEPMSGFGDMLGMLKNFGAK